MGVGIAGMAWESSRKSIVGGNVWYFQGDAKNIKLVLTVKHSHTQISKTKKKNIDACMSLIIVAKTLFNIRSFKFPSSTV